LRLIILLWTLEVGARLKPEELETLAFTRFPEMATLPSETAK